MVFVYKLYKEVTCGDKATWSLHKKTSWIYRSLVVMHYFIIYYYAKSLSVGIFKQ